MDIQVLQGNIIEYQVDTLVCALYEGEPALGSAAWAVDAAMSGAIRDLLTLGDMTGKTGQVAVVYPRGAMPASRVVLIGLGKRDELTVEIIRKAFAAGMKKARKLKASQVATVVYGAGTAGVSVAEAAQALVEGAMLGLYRFSAPKQNLADSQTDIQEIKIVELDGQKIEAIQAGISIARAAVAGTILARDLINWPANYTTPTRMAEVAQEIAEKFGLSITVGDREWAAKRDMGAFLAVAKGAGEPPKFIVLEHNGERKDLDTVVLVGKGITFDTGGISIKPAERMEDMKSDMSGAAAVLGAMRAIAELKLPLRVIGITPCTENMPDANAYRPADIITASNGKTIEIISTDAEGRMVLADALVYATQYQPKAVIDLATLTGACVIALGQGVAAGVFCNDEQLQNKLVTAGKASQERLWPMPLWDDYKQSIKSAVADMKNSGGRFGGVGTSAIFLKEFTDYPWAHIDMAGMALQAKENGYVPEGGAGFGVRLLVELLRNW
jgi:leucyl aminopeptidase